MVHIDVRKKLLSADGPFNLSVRLDISRNDFFTFFGRSGSGKTTTLRMIAGLTAPDEGEIIVDGKIWFSKKDRINIPAQKRKIGFVFQDYALFPTMTVRKNLEFAATGIKTRVDDFLDIMQIRALEHAMPSDLSGGQRQRVSLARALIRSPDILLLDEPLSALDSELRASLQKEISNIHSTFGLTSIIVTHDISEIFMLSNRMAIFRNGSVSESSSPDHVFGNSLSSRFRVSGRIISIVKSDVAAVITVQSGINMIRVVSDIDDVVNMEVGSDVIVAAKAFAPVIIPV